MAQINFRVEDDLKTQADYIFSQLGMSMSSALTIFIRQVIDRRAIPFEIRLSNPELSDPAKILQAARDYENGKVNYHYHELPALEGEETSVPRKRMRRVVRAKALV